MDEDGLIAAWRHLPTAESREKALEALLQEIDPYEWRHVHAITSQRSFQTDIIGRLPIELVIHIFAYLDPSTPYLLQRVCDPITPESLLVLIFIRSPLDGNKSCQVYACSSRICPPGMGVRGRLLMRTLLCV